MQILLSNDDGIQAAGLCALYPELCRLGDVQIVAPASEQSGVALSITYRHPLLVHEETRDGRPWGWAVAGSPADCVKLGVLEFCKETPRLIVSGINSGANAGINVLYSGTVAAAIEGAFFGITSVAVSQTIEDSPPDYALTARRAVKVIEQLLSLQSATGHAMEFEFPRAEARLAPRPQGVADGHHPPRREDGKTRQPPRPHVFLGRRRTGRTPRDGTGDRRPRAGSRLRDANAAPHRHDPPAAVGPVWRSSSSRWNEFKEPRPRE